MTTGLRQNELTLGDCVVQMLGQTLAGIRRCSNCLTTTGLRQNELTLGDGVVQMLGQTLAGIRRCSDCLTTTGPGQNGLTQGDCLDVGADFVGHRVQGRLS